MNTGCGKFEESLLDLVYDELDDAEAETLRTHAADCPACADAIAELHSVRRLSAKPFALTPPPALDDALLSAARESLSAPVHSPAPVTLEQTPGFRDLLRAWLLHPAFAGAAVLALVLSMTLFMTLQSENPSESTTPTVESVLKERTTPTAAAPAAVSDDATSIPKSEAPPAVSDETQTEKAKESKQIVPHKAEKSGGDRRSSAALSSKRSTAAPSPSFEFSSGDDEAASGVLSRRAAKESSADLGEILRSPSENTTAKRKASSSSSTFAPPPSAGRSSADAERLAVPPEADFAEEEAQDEAAFAPSTSPKAETPAAGPTRTPTLTHDAYAAGMDAYRRGNCAVAREELSEVIGYPARYPGKIASALHHLGRCEKRSGRCAAALTFYERLLAAYPGYSGRPESLYEAAHCYRRLGRTEKARNTLKELEQIPGWEFRARQMETGL